MVRGYQPRPPHPAGGGCRGWSLLAHSDISVRTVGRIMALHKLVDDAIPPMPQRGRQPPPQPHPYKAQYPHESWFIDGRQMDCALDGVKWWSILILEGSSRTRLAGALAPTEAPWAALMGLYTACVRYGAPTSLVSDSGGGHLARAFRGLRGPGGAPQHKRAGAGG